MNVVLDPQPNCIVTLQVELPAEQVTKEWLSIAKDFQRQARIPGYRPGKALDFVAANVTVTEPAPK